MTNLLIPKPDTILIIFPSTGRGGCEEYVLTLAKALHEDGNQIHVAFPDRPGTISLQEDFKKISKSYTAINFRQLQPRKHKNINLAINVWKLVRLILKINPKAIHITLPWPDTGSEAILAAAILRIKTVITFQLVNDEFKASPQLSKRYSWAGKRNQYWVSVSKNNAMLLAKAFGVREESIRVINNGVSLDRFSREVEGSGYLQLTNPINDKIILTVARLSHQKGHDILLQAFSSISDQFPGHRLYFVGEGELTSQLKLLAGELHILDRVSFVGYKQDVRDWLVAADLFVLPSRSEGFPFCLLEAMAMGLPVISSDLDCISNLISDGCEGLLFTSENVESLTGQLTWALENKNKMKEMALRARNKVELFSSKKMTEETIRLLLEK